MGRNLDFFFVHNGRINSLSAVFQRTPTESLSIYIYMGLYMCTIPLQKPKCPQNKILYFGKYYENRWFHCTNVLLVQTLVLTRIWNLHCILHVYLCIYNPSIQWIIFFFSYMSYNFVIDPCDLLLCFFTIYFRSCFAFTLIALNGFLN